MKKQMIVLFLIGLNLGVNAQIGVGTTTPDVSAAMDISSSDQGFLPPRVAGVGTISSPVAGLIIYDATEQCIKYYNGTEWSGCLSDGNGGSTGATFPAGSVFCGAGETAVVDVTSGTGKVWMDRNLGASQVATSSTDAMAYGDLYQWGRFSDGHQCRTSSITFTQATSDTPGHGDFIVVGGSGSWPFDWRAPSNDALWQGVSGTNNPCPSGYRIPTSVELQAEESLFTTHDAAGAFNSVLKLTVGGWRTSSFGSFDQVNNVGYYMSSTLYGADTRIHFGLYIIVTAGIDSYDRASGLSVRCIKD